MSSSPFGLDCIVADAHMRGMADLTSNEGSANSGIVSVSLIATLPDKQA